MENSEATLTEIDHSIRLVLKAEARVAHQKRLMTTMAGAFNTSQTREAERLVEVLEGKMLQQRRAHDLLVGKV